jgi:hypothetical protein
MIPEMAKAMNIWVYADRDVPGLKPSERAAAWPMEVMNCQRRRFAQHIIAHTISISHRTHHLMPKSSGGGVSEHTDEFFHMLI